MGKQNGRGGREGNVVVIAGIFNGRRGYLAIGFCLLILLTGTLIVLELWQFAAFGALGLIGVTGLMVLVASVNIGRLQTRFRAVIHSVKAVEAVERRLEEFERRVMGAFDVERVSEYDRYIDLQERLAALQAAIDTMNETFTGVSTDDLLTRDRGTAPVKKQAD